MLVTPILGAQTTNLAPRVISLADCVATALEHNFDIQIERFTPRIARYNLDSSYGIYDPIFQFTAKRSFEDIPAETDLKKFNPDLPYTVTTDSFGGGLAGRLPFGLQYGLSPMVNSLSADTDFTYYIRHTNDYFGTAALTLRQPLLRDFWIDSSRLTISVNKKNLKIAELAFRQQLINVITKVQVGYYDLLLAQEQVKVQERALELARQLYEDNRKRLEAGKLRPLEEKQSEAQVAVVETDLYAARQVLANRQNALRNLVADDYRNTPEVVLVSTNTLLAVSVPFNRMESWQKAMSMRPDLLQFRFDLEKKDLDVGYRYNQLFPRLDLEGSYGGRGVDDTLGSMMDDVGHFSHPAFSYGVVLSIPLSRRSERNNYQASQAARKRAGLQLKKLEQDILVQVDNAGVLTETAYMRVHSSRQARIYAEAALDAEQKRLAAGMSTSFIVLQLQRNLTDARSAEIRALSDYNQALVQLAFSEGSTLEKNNLTVDIK